MKVYTSIREEVIIDDVPFARGGEGDVYRVVSGSERYAIACVKHYFQKKLTIEQANKIKYMVSHPPLKIKGDEFLVCWPLELVTDSVGAFWGFVMPHAFPDSNNLTCLITRKMSKKLNPKWHNNYDFSNGTQARINRIKLVYNISMVIDLLHSIEKYVLTDIKPSNILITLDGRVALVDMDSVQITERNRILFSGGSGSIDYMPPEIFNTGIGNSSANPIAKTWDLFAIGVVFYQLLIGCHPYAVIPSRQQDPEANTIPYCISHDLFPFGENKNEIYSYSSLHDDFKTLPKQLQDLFVRTFSGRSLERPTACEWRKVSHGVLNDSLV